VTNLHTDCSTLVQGVQTASKSTQDNDQHAEFLRKAAALGIKVSPYYRRMKPS